MRKRRFKTGIHQKIAAVVVFIILITMVVPYLVFSHTSRNQIGRTVDEQFSRSLLGTIEYLKAHDLPLSDAEMIHGGGIVSVGVSGRADDFTFDAAQQERLAHEGEVIYVHHEEKGLIAVTKSEGQYVYCWLNLADFFRQMRLGGILSLLVSVLLGTAAMLFASHRVTRSLRRLDSATRKVAAGDFSQRVPARGRDEMSSLAESFNIMAEELGSVEMLRSNFISDISHEFKTPLTAIEGYAKLLAQTADGDERQEYVAIITEETGRLCTLADNILMLNKIEKGNIPAQKAPVRIDEQIRRALALCERKWEEKGLELELELDAVTIEAYDVLLMQLWTNLIDNAIKFSPHGGTIAISLHRPAHEMLFSITDQGPGVALDKQERIFEKFYKADQSRGADGNGLGLSIVHRVAQLHGGSVRIISTPGEGAAFCVTI